MEQIIMKQEEAQKGKEDNIDVQIDILKWLYYESKDVLQKESDRLQNDITEEVYAYIEDKILNKEIINMAFRGEVSGSKSTSAIALMNYANLIIERQFTKRVDRFSHIFADQTEFLRFINKEERDVAIVIDEFSRVAETGLNASTETALFDYYSDVFAQKFIHRFSCSPSVILDKNATIVLDYIGKDEINMVSKFKVGYRNPVEGFREVTLGFVNIDVSKVLNEDFYKKYRKKKFDRMALLDKHGVRDIRELEFATITLPVVEELKELATDGTKITMDTIMATTSRICRESKRIYSLLVTNEIASRCRNLLNYYTEIGRIRYKLFKIKSDGEKIILEHKLNKFIEMMRKDYDEEVRREIIYREYLNIK